MLYIFSFLQYLHLSVIAPPLLRNSTIIKSKAERFAINHLLPKRKCVKNPWIHRNRSILLYCILLLWSGWVWNLLVFSLEHFNIPCMYSVRFGLTFAGCGSSSSTTMAVVLKSSRCKIQMSSRPQADRIMRLHPFSLLNQTNPIHCFFYSKGLIHFCLSFHDCHFIFNLTFADPVGRLDSWSKVT